MLFLKNIYPCNLQRTRDQNLWILAIIGLANIVLTHFIKLNYKLNTSYYIIITLYERW